MTKETTPVERSAEAEAAWERGRSVRATLDRAVGKSEHVHLGGSGNREWLDRMDLDAGEARDKVTRWVFRAVPHAQTFIVEPVTAASRALPGGASFPSGKSLLAFLTPVIFADRVDATNKPTHFNWIPGWEWISWFLLPEIAVRDSTSVKPLFAASGGGMIKLGSDSGWQQLRDWGVIGLQHPDKTFEWSLLKRPVTFDEVGRKLIESISRLNMAERKLGNV